MNSPLMERRAFLGALVALGVAKSLPLPRGLAELEQTYHHGRPLRFSILQQAKETEFIISVVWMYNPIVWRERVLKKTEWVKLEAGKLTIEEAT